MFKNHQLKKKVDTKEDMIDGWVWLDFAFFQFFNFRGCEKIEKKYKFKK